MKAKYPVATILACAFPLVFGLGLSGCSSLGRGGTPTADGSVKIEKEKVTAEWKTYWYSGKGGRPMKQLVVDGRIVLRESDVDGDGRTDSVRVRLTSGDYVLIRDTDGDGDLDTVRRMKLEAGDK